MLLSIMLVRADILSTQRSLAEITELIYTAELIHQSVMDISTHPPHTSTPAANGNAANSSSSALTSKQLDDLKFGNKLAILIGDFLLSNASAGLGKLNCTEVSGKAAQV